MLLEREGELATLHRALRAAVARDGTVVRVAGPAGIGKSSLVRAARAAAPQAGLRAGAARCSDLERDYAWGTARALFEPLLRALDPEARAQVLSGAAAVATAVVAVPDATAPRPEADEGTVLHGLFWLCANLAEQAPLLLAVDDAHWADVASLRYLTYLARRLEGLPVALVVAHRTGEDAEREALLDRLDDAGGARVVRPGPLGRSAVGALLARRLAGEPSAAVVGACTEATRGNPFLVEELARSLDPAALPDAGAIADIGPRTVARSVLARVAGLATGAEAVARAVAVLDADARVPTVAALAGLDADRAAAVVDALAAAEVLDGASPPGFVHPLVRAAVLEDLPPRERARLHGAAARVLAAAGEPPGRLALHLVHTLPSGSAETVRTLHRAAARAVAEGAPAAAAMLLRRALAEPPPVAELVGVLEALGAAEAADGRTREAEEHLRRAIEAAPDGMRRAGIALELSRALGVSGDFAAAGAVAIKALADGALAGTPVEIALEAELFTVAQNELALGGGPRLGRRLRELQAGALADGPLLAPLALALAAMQPPGARAIEVAVRASATTPTESSMVPGCIGNALLFAGDPGGAAAYYAGVAAEAARRGLRPMLSFATSFESRAWLAMGDVRRAEERARLGVELLEEGIGDPGPHARGYSSAHLALVLLALGEHEELDRLLASEATPAGRPTTYAGALLQHAGAALRLATQRPAEALDDACAPAATVLAATNPAMLPWRSVAAEALAALDRHEEGLEHARRELELARAFAVPGAIARALRAVARCDPGGARAHLDEARATVSGSVWGLEEAAVTVELGSVHRRTGHRTDAVQELRRGLDLAHRCGARALAARAREELVTAGARPRRAALSGVDALTAAERRVVDLAATGVTNKEIAQRLFVTTRTVEAHLTRAFRKLGVGSREELPAALDPMARWPGFRVDRRS